LLTVYHAAERKSCLDGTNVAVYNPLVVT